MIQKIHTIGNIFGYEIYLHVWRKWLHMQCDKKITLFIVYSIVYPHKDPGNFCAQHVMRRKIN